MKLSAPTFDELVWPTLLALREMGGSASNEELLSKVISVANISDDVMEIVHSDGRQPKVQYNLAWAKTYLKKAGALDNSQRGVWSLTDMGEHLTQADVATVPGIVRKAYVPSAQNVGSTELDDAIGYDELASWKDQLLKSLLSMEPSAFERLSQRMLREAGFIKVEVTGKSGDGGIDGIGVLRVNLLSFTTFFQCKRYAGTVGAGAVRDFRGAMVGRGDKGLVITTGTFSADARREATRDGAPAIDLIDGDMLCQLLKDLKLGVKTIQVEQVLVEEEFFLQL
jgi:restriction system protein